MTIFPTVLLLASLAVSAEVEMPSDFLKMESKTWNRWLDEDVNIHWEKFPLKDILDSTFGAAEIKIDQEKKLSTPVTFDAAKLTRRAVLWHLSQKYEFKVRWEQKKEPEVFLELPETEEREQSIGGRDITTMTYVMRADYKTYLELKRNGKITHEKQVEDTIYYSFDVDRDMHFENGTTAHVMAVQRYKTTKPNGKTPVDPKKN